MWTRDVGYLAAASPAYGAQAIFVTVLERTKGVRAGQRRRDLGAKRGKVEWSKPLPSRTESSPLVVDHRLYFGAEDGTVYAMRAGTTAACSGRSGPAAPSRAASR